VGAFHVIASAAKQSKGGLRKKLDCFVVEPVNGAGHFGPEPLAPRNDEKYRGGG
jgi:hypothetical protein